MKSSKASTLKGLPNQIIKQIVKVVLPSDVVQLQPGRKPKKGGRKPKAEGKPKKPRGTSKPPSGNLPKAPEGVLSHITRPGKPPAAYSSVFGAPTARPFAQPSFQPPASSPYEKMYEKLLEKLKETPTGTAPTPAAVSAPSVIRPTVGSSSLADQIRSRSKSMMDETAIVLERARAARSRSRSQAGQMMAEEIPRPAIASPLLRMQPLSGAPNQAVQPSVDVDGDGKQAIELQPQAPASTFIQSQKAPSPSSSSSSSASSSSEMFFNVREISRDLSPQRVENPSARLAVVEAKLRELMKEKPSTKGKGAKARMKEWEDRQSPLKTEYNMLREEIRKEELGAGGAVAYFEIEENEFPEIVNEED